MAINKVQVILPDGVAQGLFLSRQIALPCAGFPASPLLGVHARRWNTLNSGSTTAATNGRKHQPHINQKKSSLQQTKFHDRQGNESQSVKIPQNERGREGKALLINFDDRVGWRQGLCRLFSKQQTFHLKPVTGSSNKRPTRVHNN